MTVLITVALLVAAAVVVVGRVFFKAMIDQFARRQADSLGDRLADWGRLLAARRAARRGDAPGLVLATASSPDGRRAYEALQERVAPTPEVAALLTATVETAGPFAGRRALLIGVGAGSAHDITAALAHAGQRTVSGTFLVDPAAAAAVPAEVGQMPGDLWRQVDASLRWAKERLDDKTGDFIAILLRTPVTGDWTREADLDLDRLVGTLLTAEGDVWLAVSDPGDPSAWPSEVVVSLPAPVRTLWLALRESQLPRIPKKSRIDRHTVRLPAGDAASLIVSITNPSAQFERTPSGTPTAQRYGAAVTLALGQAAREGRARVAPDDAALRAAEEFLEATGTRITSRLHGTERRLSLAAYPSRTVAWRLTSVPRADAGVSSLPRDPAHPQAAISSASNRDKSVKAWLEAAIDFGDEPIASAILAAHGRAWIEESPIDPSVRLLELAKDSFEASSRTALWAHYLLALDSALRFGKPDRGWFTEEFCSMAERTELGLLFQAERAEFARLRGEIEDACVISSQLLPRLENVEKPSDTGGAYAIATSRYVTANLLRQGGQYDLARQFIDAATIQYEPKLPSHRVELTHCRYGRSVCDAMRGVAAVHTGGDWTADEAVFAQSLVTLANSHAAWFIADYDRAIQFAEEARAGFARIGYERYAARAQRLEGLLDDWARRSGRPRPAEEARPVDASVQLLLEAPPQSRVIALANERPSRALSVLQFALAYGDDPNTRRTVELPQYIAITPSQNLITVTAPPAASYQEADNALRGILGVGSGIPVPLAVD